MTYFPVQPRYSVYIDSLGDPLDDGYIYLGKANLDPTVYPAKASWDEAGLYPITFPVRTMNGYPLRDGIPAQMYLNFADNTEYSVLINDEDGVEVYSSTTGLIGYFPSGGGGDAATLEGHPASYFAVDSEVVHLASTEEITGVKNVADDTAFNIGDTTTDGSMRLFTNSAANGFTLTPFKSGALVTTKQISYSDSTAQWNIEGTPTIEGNTIYHAGNDGSGSGLDADLLDGYQSSVAISNSTVVVRSSQSNIAGRTFSVGESGNGDSVINFYDDTNSTFRSLRWDDTNSDWYIEDSSGVNRQLYHAGTSSASDTFTTADAKTVTVVNGLITSIV